MWLFLVFSFLSCFTESSVELEQSLETGVAFFMSLVLMLDSMHRSCDVTGFSELVVAVNKSGMCTFVL